LVSLGTIAYEGAAIPGRVLSSIAARFRKPKGKPPLFLFGFNEWKTFMVYWFPEKKVIFTPMSLWPIELAINWRWRILSDPRSEVLAWQYKAVPGLKKFCKANNIPFSYVEDGFLRSISIGALHVPPLSLAFDTKDMYFNANAPTDLESILREHDFDGDEALMTRARAGMKLLLESGLSKYNSGVSRDVSVLYGPKTKKRILVIGQVERDASIVYGCKTMFQNNDLVWLARRENPEAQIIYKPHPEVLSGTAPTTSYPQEVSGAAQVLVEDISLSDALETIDHVYTMTSLAGFEALLRGIKVTTVGCPFYSGWGLTDDRQPNGRRTRKLTIDQLFAAAYLLYPKYIDPILQKRIEFEEALSLLQFMRMHSPKKAAVDSESANERIAIEAIRTVLDKVVPLPAREKRSAKGAERKQGA
jgi:capsular polysaccharide export protein